jgi:hypothetical protein
MTDKKVEEAVKIGKKYREDIINKHLCSQTPCSKEEDDIGFALTELLSLAQSYLSLAEGCPKEREVVTTRDDPSHRSFEYSENIGANRMRSDMLLYFLKVVSVERLMKIKLPYYPARPERLAQGEAQAIHQKIVGNLK